MSFRASALALAIVALSGASAAQEPATWKPFQEFGFLVGSWSGTADAAGRVGGRIVSFTQEMGDVVLLFRGKTILPAFEGKPEETNQEQGSIAYDGESRKYQATIYFSTGVWGIFDVDVAADGTIRLTASQLVNFEKGARSRITFAKKGDSELSVLLELAPAGKEFVPLSVSKLTRR
jgi:hypothetical protein